MVKPPNKWKHIDVVLEIDGKVIDTKVTSHVTFKSIYTRLLREGQTQRLPWALFISRSNYKKPRVINSGWGQDRDRNGKFTKVIYT